MTTTQPLSLFISSKMAELTKERQAVQRALKNYKMYGWLFEKDAGARPESIQETYLEEVASCDIYIGLFWQGYGEYTIEEYDAAKRVVGWDDDARAPQLCRLSVSGRDYQPCRMALFPLPAWSPHGGGVAGPRARDRAAHHRFAVDSPLEGTGFEPSVPRQEKW